VGNTAKNREPLIQVKDLKKYFPLKKNTFMNRNQIYIRAVEDINLTIYKGETFGLVGESGCGKSTLGRTILQLYEPTSGSVTYYGDLVGETSLKYVETMVDKLPYNQQKAKLYFYLSKEVDSKIPAFDAELLQIDKQLKSPLQEQEKKKLESKQADLAHKIALLRQKSFDYKKQSSRYLRESSHLVGSLILCQNIEEIKELLKKTVEFAKHYRDVIDGLNGKYASYFTPEIIATFEKVNSFHGKNLVAINDYAMKPEFQAKLDWYKESGIILNKLSYEDMRMLRRKLQVIFQDPYSSLDSRMTIGQIIGEAVAEHGLYKRGSKELEDYVLQTMEKCGVAHYMLHRYPHQFSGGQRQRVGIARALALDPEFIVCDEAVSALDVSIQSQIINLLAELKEKENLTYLFISHDLSVIKHISDRIGVMYLGTMVELGPSDEIYQNPLHPYTKALMSAIPTTDEVQPERIILEGDIPSNIFPPSGCKFRTRCPLATEKCAQLVPEYKEVLPGHFVACHYYEKTKDMK